MLPHMALDRAKKAIRDLVVLRRIAVAANQTKIQSFVKQRILYVKPMRVLKGSGEENLGRIIDRS